MRGVRISCDMLLRKRLLESIASFNLVSSSFRSLMSVADPKYELAPLPKSTLSISTHRMRCHRYSSLLERNRISVVYESRPLLSVETLITPFLASSTRLVLGRS